MLKHIFPICLLLFSCTETTNSTQIGATIAQSDDGYAAVIPAKDTLVITCEDEEFTAGSSCGYKNSAGETVIQSETFDHCFSSTFHQFAYVIHEKKYGNKIVAVNRNLEVIFDAYMYDNGPDYPSEGLFRIVKNGKIGYADETGNVVIEPQYSCAFPFEEGKAKVAIECQSIPDGEYTSPESDEWIFIDLQGNATN